MSDTVALSWQPIAKAPKDGSRILVTIHSTEQGDTEVDVVRWTKSPRDDEFCWMSTDSSFDCPVMYENWELTFWMPLPSWFPNVKAPGMASQLPAAPGPGDELDGSGI